MTTRARSKPVVVTNGRTSPHTLRTVRLCVASPMSVMREQKRLQQKLTAESDDYRELQYVGKVLTIYLLSGVVGLAAVVGGFMFLVK